MKQWIIRILRSACLLMAIGAIGTALNYFGMPNRTDSNAMMIAAVVICALFTGAFIWLKKFDPACPKWAFWASLIGTWVAISVAVIWPQRSNAIKRHQGSAQLNEFNAARELDLTQRTEAKLSVGQDVDYITSAEALRANAQRRSVGTEGFDPAQRKILLAVRNHYDRGLELKKISEDAGLKFYEHGGISPGGLSEDSKAQARLTSLSEFSRSVSDLNEYWLNYSSLLERAMLDAGALPALASEVAGKSAEHYMTEDQLLITDSNADSARAARDLINFLILTSSRWTYDSAQDAVAFEVDAEIDTYNELLGKFEATQRQTQLLLNQLVAKRNAKIKSR